MAIKVDQLDYAISEAKRFLLLANKMKRKSEATYPEQEYPPGQLPAAVKRASMDLTRALAELRR